MGRLTGENIEHYSAGSSNNRSYFSLKDDKDTARVRFLYSGGGDIEAFAVHRVKVGDKERYVNCRMEDDGTCPFCEAKIPKTAKLFIPLYNEDTNQFQIWERGQKFYGTISGLCSRYSSIVSRTFDIERNGKKNDQSTTYSIYPVGDADGTTVQDILDDLEMEEIPDPLGTIILDKSADDMGYYLDNGASFPVEDDTPVRRRSSEAKEEAPRRRSRGGDRF